MSKLFVAFAFALMFPLFISAQELEKAETIKEVKGYRESSEKNFANTVFLQALNKVSTKTSIIQIPLNSSVKFGALEVRLENCWKSAPEERPESAALLQVFEQKQGEDKKQIFFGWMFSSNPSISSIEHSVYDLTVLECKRI